MRSNYEYLINEFRKANEHNDNGWFIDGPLTDTYWNANFKISVINLESYGYEDCPGTILDYELLKTWIFDKHPTPNYSSLFVNIIKRAYSLGQIPEKNELRGIFRNKRLLIEGMNDVAYINIRKSSNSKVEQNIDEIRKDLLSNSNYLKKQIEYLESDLYIWSGVESIRTINSLYGTHGIRLNSLYKIDNKNMLTVSHFSRADYSNYIYLAGLFIDNKRNLTIAST